jgi:hypothetical protein
MGKESVEGVIVVDGRDEVLDGEAHALGQIAREAVAEAARGNREHDFACPHANTRLHSQQTGARRAGDRSQCRGWEGVRSHSGQTRR